MFVQTNLIEINNVCKQINLVGGPIYQEGPTC